MSSVATASSHELNLATKPNESSLATLRVWPAVVLTIALWLFLYANHELELDQGTRFFSSIIGMGVALLSSGWA
jgi:hypothetical protein